MNFVKCTITGREAYKQICNVLINRQYIEFDVTPTLTFFSRWSYEANLFWDYHPHQYSCKIEWRRDADYSESESLTHDFYFHERDCRCLLSFYNVLVPLELNHMSHFLIIIIGHRNFLNTTEELIYLFNHNVWFSLYESQSPSYFICFNTINLHCLGAILEIDINRLHFV